uniref:Zinc finger protein 292b n=1 Tax=Takifugu rubripes TaxID=31033 RepID=A0A674P9Z9_TAKRU
MADEEAEVDPSPEKGIGETVLELRERLQKLEEVALRQSSESAIQSSTLYCQGFCRTLLEFAGRWSIEEDPLPLVEVYIVALLSYAQASYYLSLQCENVPLVVERLSLSFVELLLSLKITVPEDLWKKFQLSVQFSSAKLQENGISQPSVLVGLCQYDGVWNSQVLKGLLSREKLQPEEVATFLMQEGPVLLEMRVKQLMKDSQAEKAAALAAVCSQCPAFPEKSSFKQLYLVCLCATSERDQLMEELSKEDCHDALEMICNLESDGDEKAAFSLCSAFLTRQLLQGDSYCAWELTLFWSKLLKRLEPTEQAFLDQCRQMSLLSKTVYHILFLIKVIDHTGLPVCIEMCIRALRVESDDGNTKASVCKTISCLLPTDLEVKRACQLTEFLLEPTVDAYYAVETLYNEPDQKVEEEKMPVPNSLRCELLLVLKTQWPFDPEFWDWRTLKRQCLALMGEEASIVSSIDLLNEEEPQQDEEAFSQVCFNNTSENLISDAYEVPDVKQRRQKNREIKKLRDKGFISTKVRHWQAYMQYCVLCDKEFLGHRIVRHAQIHFCNGVYRCPICAQSFSTKDIFLPHVKSHVKQSCKERLNALKTKELTTPEVSVPDTAASKLKMDNDLKEKFVSQVKNGMLMPHVEIRLSRCDMETADAYVCPVGKCRRSLKFLKNLIAHVKSHGDDEEAKTFLEMRSKKVVCQYCRRRFVSTSHLNDHSRLHSDTNPYACVQLNCKARFQSNGELLEHKRTHPDFRARCMFPNCGKIFSQAYKLYDHEELHYKRFTCKVGDCGKVFQSLKLLDLHQEKHVGKKESTSLGTKPQNMQPVSLIKQMLTSHNQPESSLGKSSSKSAAHPEFEQFPVTTESSRKPSDISVDPHNKVKTELQTSQSQDLIKSVIQPINPNLSDSDGHRCGLGSDPLDSPRPFHSNKHNAQMIKSQPQIFNTDAPLGSVSYKSESNLPFTEQQQPLCSSRLSSVSPLYTPTEPVSQPISPVKRDMSLTTMSDTAPPAGQNKRYHCAFQTCRRHYGAQRSVTKHMRASHPDFYEQWKHARTPIKVTYVLAPKARLVTSDFSGDQQNSRLPVPGVPRENIIQSQPHTNTTIPNYAPVHSQSSLNPNFSVKLETGLTPSVLSQLGSDRNPNGQKWHSASPNEQSQHSGSSIICPSDTNTPSFSMRAATLQVPPLGSVSHPVLPSLMTEIEQSKTSSSAECAKVDVPSTDSAMPRNGNIQTRNFPRIPKNDPNHHKPASRSRRSKWPAIVRDGKFICCLCFKEFVSPKSLGGHLSKGAACKQNKSDLSTQLPNSVLHFPIQDQTSVPSQPSLCDIEETGMSVYYNQTPNPNFCAPYYSAERLPGVSVIQPTETALAKHQGASACAARYSQPNVKTYDGGHFSNPVHPHIPSENLATGPRSTKQREQYISEGQNSETTVQSIDTNPNSVPRLKLTDSQKNSSMCGRTTEVQRKTLEDVKRRLREQILADEFQNKTKSVRNAGTNANVNNPMSFGSLCSLPPNSEVQQVLNYTNSDSVIQKSSAVIPETSKEIQHSLNTQSFTGFRESSALRAEILSPTHVITHDADLEPSDSSGSHQQGMTEIQSAFEKLQLATEVSAHSAVPVKPNPKAGISKAGSTKTKGLCSAQFKPFACETKNCSLRFMTGIALWRHLSKVHNYTVDMVNVAKKRYGQYAPFKCQICNKSFTRNSSLRVHYHSTHKLSTKEMEEMDVRPQQAAATTTAMMVQTASQETTPTHSSLDNRTETCPTQNAVTQYCSSQAFVPCSIVATTNEKHQDFSHLTSSQHLQAAGPCSQANELPPPGNQSAITSETKKPSIAITKKTKEKKPALDHCISPLRPYRCSHQGCKAAFTIQHNLILHYRVVHQSALSALAVSKDPAQNNGLEANEEDYAELFRISEFRCQVKDCSRVFQEVPNLVQHYFHLHLFGVDYIGDLLSNIKPQTFICGYQGCPAVFNTACMYIGHVREQHNDMLDQLEQLNCSFRCEFEGCDRSYATKSNMVRHYMKKHGKLYRAKLKKEQIKRAKLKRSSGALRYQLTKAMNGKENIESNRKIWKRGDAKRKKRSKNNIWTAYGKPSLKTKVEASALCTKKFPLQYPCMIKGCESVMKSERNILKHYLGHGLSEKFLEHQRSHFIFCKKTPRLRWSSLRSDDSKSDSELSSSEMTVETSPDEDDSGGSKPVLRRRTSAKIPIVLFDSKLSNIEGFGGSLMVKRKRGRPRKFPERLKPKKIARPKLDLECSGEEESDFSSPALMQQQVSKLSAPLATFKPMGFEMSFLKFLEQSNKSDHSLTMNLGGPIQNAEDICVHFRNHKKLKSLSKVKIIIDGAFSGVTNLMLTQLQDMRPTVVLRGK